MEKILADDIEGRVMDGVGVDYDEALLLMNLGGDDAFWLLELADRVRDRHKGNEVAFCSIVNAKSGNCSEDCGFCSQSAYSDTGIEEYPMMDPEEIVKAARDSHNMKATRFGIVIGRKGIKYSPRSEREKIFEAIRALKEDGSVIPDASLGILSWETALELKEAGLEGYHHNLETSRRFFPNICTTHSYDERVETIRIAKAAGFYACSGGIFGMGESVEDRVDMAFTLRELDVDSIPVNFLVAIPGTKLENQEPLDQLEILKIIAVYRLIFPTKDIRMCGGREKNLGDMQSLIFAAGANATLIGNYLTTFGREPLLDIKMVEDLGFELTK